MKHTNKFYWYIKSFQSFDYLLFQPNHFSQLVNTCLKCLVHNKLTGLRRVYLGIASLVSIINLLIAPAGNVLMRLGCQGKGTEDFSRQWLFSNLELSSWKAILVPGNYSYSDKGQFHVMDITFRDQPFNVPSLSYVERLFKYLPTENFFK